MKRIHSIDILRAIAILLMVEIHFVDYLSYTAERDTLLYGILEALGSIPAPLFAFLAGASLFISLSKYTAEIARKQTLRRGVAIFIIGLIHYLIHWGVEYLFDWDILTLIGSALLIIYFLRRARGVDIVLIIIGIMLISPTLREFTGYNLHWNFELSEYSYAFTFKDIFLGWLVNGIFPIFPWIIFPLAGYASGRFLLNTKNDAPEQIKHARIIILLGVSLAFFSALGVWSGYFAPLLFYPASTTYLLLTLGISLVSFAGLWLLLDAQEMSIARAKWTQGRLALPIQRFSRYSLTIYLLHHSVHLYPLYLIGYFKSGDRWHYFANAISIEMALLLTLLCILLFYFIITQWDKIKGRYSLEWLLTRIIKG